MTDGEPGGASAPDHVRDPADDEIIEAVGLLAEPVRRDLYRRVIAAPTALSRDQAAAATGVSRSLAAFHLDKLVEAGLLAVSYRRRSGRSGPGAGRPAKFYHRAERDHAVSLPPREYPALARLLATVVDEAGLEPALARVAGRAGAAAAPGGPASRDELLAVLEGRGYQPYRDGDSVRLRNCPFHALAREFPPLICGMNLALLEGLVHGADTDADGIADVVGVGVAARAGPIWSARLDPRPGECCVVLNSKTNKS